MTLIEFEQLDAEQKAISLLSADLLADISLPETITQLYTLDTIYVKMVFCKQTRDVLDISPVTAIDELLPFVKVLRQQVA